MRILLLILVTVLLLEDVASEGEDGVIKRGTYPFMAFIYYPDQAIDNGSGVKFTRSAVLIRQNWLISASLESENTPIAFPEKTLVARLGAISIDVRFNFNEDEGEQEREIVKIARPYDFNNTEWWYSDISLLKTLMPFNITSAVATIATRASTLTYGENCFMLVYAKFNQNTTEERILMKISVELISSSQDRCGGNFNNASMVCAAPSDENSKIFTDLPNFCMGNGGGPLICDNALLGTQTYIDNCNQPYLYQLLSSWDDLISCAMEEKCEEEQCAKMCFTIHKDPPTATTPKISVTEEVKMMLADGYVNETTIETMITTTSTTFEETSEKETLKTTSTTIKEEEDAADITTSTTVSHIQHIPQRTEDTSSSSSENTDSDVPDFPEERERKTNVEAKQHGPRSDASINMLYSLKYLIYGYFIIMRLT